MSTSTTEIKKAGQANPVKVSARGRSWAAHCRLCAGRTPEGLFLLAGESDFVHRAACRHAARHACPSWLASGERCGDACTDCGGRGWV